MESHPSESELRAEAKRIIAENVYYWKPFIMGLAILSEEAINNASPFGLLIIDEVLNYKNEFLETRVLKAELVERRK